VKTPTTNVGNSQLKVARGASRPFALYDRAHRQLLAGSALCARKNGEDHVAAVNRTFIFRDIDPNNFQPSVPYFSSASFDMMFVPPAANMPPTPRQIDLDARDLGPAGGNTALVSLLYQKGRGRTDPDDAPEPPAHPVAEPGDLWVLGRHRLLCGDSTVATDVERVLGGVAPHLMVTDGPPRSARQRRR
jgi:hypothetical protein